MAVARLISAADKAKQLPKDLKTNQVFRLLYFVGAQVEINAPDDVECGVYNLIAAGLTEEELAALEWLLTFPFRCGYWPFEGYLGLEALAKLNIKILEGD